MNDGDEVGVEVELYEAGLLDRLAKADLRDIDVVPQGRLSDHSASQSQGSTTSDRVLRISLVRDQMTCSPLSSSVRWNERSFSMSLKCASLAMAFRLSSLSPASRSA